MVVKSLTRLADLLQAAAGHWGLRVLTFQDLLALGVAKPVEPAAVAYEDLATIMFTSDGRTAKQSRCFVGARAAVLTAGAACRHWRGLQGQDCLSCC